MIYVFLADGFEEIEAVATIDILRRAELDVKIVGVGSKNITGAHHITIMADITDKEATAKGLEMIVLPGGMPGALNLEKSEYVKDIIKLCDAYDLYIAAICAAPSILGRMGLCKGKNITCYPGFETQLPDSNYTGGGVTVDGKYITGKGPGVAIDFSLKLVEMLLGEERAKILGDSLQM